MSQQHRGGDRSEKDGAREVGCQGQSRQLRGREGRQQGAEEADPGHAGGERPASARKARDGEGQDDGAGEQQCPERGFRTAPSGEESERHRRCRAPRHEAEIPLRHPVDAVDDSGGQQAPRRQAGGQNGDGGADHGRTLRKRRGRVSSWQPVAVPSRLVASVQPVCRTVVRPAASVSPRQTWKDSPQPQLETAFGLLKRNPAPMMSST